MFTYCRKPLLTVFTFYRQTDRQTFLTKFTYC